MYTALIIGILISGIVCCAGEILGCDDGQEPNMIFDNSFLQREKRTLLENGPGKRGGASNRKVWWWRDPEINHNCYRNCGFQKYIIYERYISELSNSEKLGKIWRPRPPKPLDCDKKCRIQTAKTE